MEEKQNHKKTPKKLTIKDSSKDLEKPTKQISQKFLKKHSFFLVELFFSNQHEKQLIFNEIYEKRTIIL